jgi:hypothetical protein
MRQVNVVNRIGIPPTNRERISYDTLLSDERRANRADCAARHREDSQLPEKRSLAFILTRHAGLVPASTVQQRFSSIVEERMPGRARHDDG